MVRALVEQIGVIVKRLFDAKIVGRDFDLALREVVRAMYVLERVLEQYEGDEAIICDGYPFVMDYSEQVAEVHGWLDLVVEKVGR